MRADAGVGPHALGHCETVLEQAVERGLQRMRAARGLPCVLDLAQDLRLAQYQRIQPDRDAEQMPHRLGVGVPVKIRVQRGNAQVVVFLQPAHHGRFGLRLDPRVQLGAVAGREQHGLVHAIDCAQRTQRFGQRFGCERDLLAQRDRGGLVVQADGQQGHGAQVDAINLWDESMRYRQL
jgi:hypothetical protein